MWYGVRIICTLNEQAGRIDLRSLRKQDSVTQGSSENMVWSLNYQSIPQAEAISLTGLS